MDSSVGMVYLKSISGLFKITECILSFLSFLCAMLFLSSWSWSKLAFLKTTALMALCYAVAILLFRIIHCTKGFSSIPWNKLDAVCSLILPILILISVFMFVGYEKPASLEASTIFAYACAAVFELDTIYKIVFLLH